MLFSLGIGDAFVTPATECLTAPATVGSPPGCREFPFHRRATYCKALLNQAYEVLQAMNNFSTLFSSLAFPICPTMTTRIFTNPAPLLSRFIWVCLWIAHKTARHPGWGTQKVICKFDFGLKLLSFSVFSLSALESSVESPSFASRHSLHLIQTMDFRCCMESTYNQE